MIEGGSARVTDALGEALGEQVRLGRRLTRVEEWRHGYRLTFAPDEIVEADYVVIAMPFPVLRRLDLKVELPETLRRFIDEVDLGVAEHVQAGFTDKVWRSPTGFAGEAWSDLGFAECWDMTQRQPHDPGGILTFFVGGDDAEATLRWSGRRRGREFVRRLDEALPGLEAAANGQFLRSNWRRERFSRGSYVNFRPGQLTTFADHFWIEAEDPEERQEVRVGNLLFAGEHLSDAFYGFMNGAAETGRLAAESIARMIEAET